MEKELLYKILSIKDLGFSLNEASPAPDSDPIVYINVGFSLDIPAGVMSFVVTTVAHSSTDIGTVYYSAKVKTEYFILNLKDFLVGEGEAQVFNIPDPFGISVLSMAITHARAIQAKNLASSVYSESIMPIVNPTEMWRNLAKNVSSNTLANKEQHKPE
jgi:hypothetical protein